MVKDGETQYRVSYSLFGLLSYIYTGLLILPWCFKNNWEGHGSYEANLEVLLQSTVAVAEKMRTASTVL